MTLWKTTYEVVYSNNFIIPILTHLQILFKKVESEEAQAKYDTISEK